VLRVQLEYWRTEERNPVIKEHRVIYRDSTVYCDTPGTARRQGRSIHTSKHRNGPTRTNSHGKPLHTALAHMENNSISQTCLNQKIKSNVSLIMVDEPQPSNNLLKVIK